MKRKEKKMGSPIALDVHNLKGAVVSKTELPGDIFNIPVKEGLVHFVATANASNARSSTASVKHRGEVRGGGRKPWKQKGTGRARHGSIRSPIWKGGGVVFGPTTDRNWKIKVNKKVKQQAIRMVLSDHAMKGTIILIDSFDFPTKKTKDAFTALSALSLRDPKKTKTGRRVGVIVPPKSQSIRNIFRNLPRTELLSPLSLSVVELLKCATLLIPLASLQEIIRLFSQEKNEKVESLNEKK